MKKINQTQIEKIHYFIKRGLVPYKNIGKVFGIPEAYIFEISQKLGLSRKGRGRRKYNKITEAYLKALYAHFDNYRLVSEESGIPLKSIHKIIQKGRHGYR